MPELLKIDVTEVGYKTFLDISVFLTGFSGQELQATGMQELYYYTVMKEPDQGNLFNFFDEARSIIDTKEITKEKIVREIEVRLIPSSKYFELAKRIILLWYTGIWTSVNVTVEKTMAMVSPEYYKEGLIWTVAETHPAGARQPGYGSWKNPPLNKK